MAIYRGSVAGWPSIHGRGPIGPPAIARGIWPCWNGANCYGIWEVDRRCRLWYGDNPKPAFNAKACTGGVYRTCDNGNAALCSALVSCSYDFRCVYAGHINAYSPNNRSVIHAFRNEYDVSLFVAARTPISNTGYH